MKKEKPVSTLHRLTAGRRLSAGCVPFALLCVILISGCNDKLYYVSDPVVFGNVTKKGDLSLAVGSNLGSSTKGFHCHGSAATSDRHYVIASYTQYSRSGWDHDYTKADRETLESYFSGSSILAAAGGYKAIGEKFFVETALGVNYANNISETWKTKVEFRHLKYFMQPALNYTGKYFQMGLGFRIGVINLMTPRFNSMDMTTIRQENIPFIDPGFSMAVGTGYLKLGFQFSMTIAEHADMASHEFLGYSDQDAVSLSVFLKCTIPGKPKRPQID